MSELKLHFEPNLSYQREAIEAVCELFAGQETGQTEFTVTMPATDGQEELPFAESGLGIGNRLRLLDDELLTNLQAVQISNGLVPTEELRSGDFTVEMETGTGKTYVYLRTIFELNKRYGFTKFVIVVPSVAIKEGVYKTLEITEEHFRGLYAGTPFNYFLYDSAKLGQVRNFATSAQIEIMVVTVGAINKKDVNNLYKDSEKTGGERPIDLIKATEPVVIVDEPQSVDGGLQGRGKEALDAMSPLCTLRYSATHVDKHNMVYRLDAVDAYEQKLVKQIEVASATVEDASNKPYVRLIDTRTRSGTVSARIEVSVNTSSGPQNQIKDVLDGEDLEQTTGRSLYADHTIGTISSAEGSKLMELRTPGSEHFLHPGEAYGDIDQLAVARQMIKRTIQEHLEKEMRLGETYRVKVLSLFFIDAVDKYRQYDDNGDPVQGVYAKIFEEEYARFARNPNYAELFAGTDPELAASEAHEGYFSIDKKGGWTDTAENNQTNRENAERAYNLIMKDKELLLSFKSPLKFIFSHSALREGWDNPNVFQICSLRDIRTERERRQTIGRGLRLCVDQDGNRLHGFDINTLTVVATEAYEEFAEALQNEIEEDTGIRFGVVDRHEFAAISTPDEDGQLVPIGSARSEALWEHLRDSGYINAQGRVQDDLRSALKDDSLELPEDCEDRRPQIQAVLRKLAGRLEVKNADERRLVRTREAVLQSEAFKALWDRVKDKTTYRVAFDNEALIAKCITAVAEARPVAKTRLQWRKAGIGIGEAGVTAEEKEGASTILLRENDVELPDILTVLQDRTQLTRRSLQRILCDSGRLQDFRSNPQDFLDLVAETVNGAKQLALVDGIKYQRLGADYYYAQELFESEELTAYVKNSLAGAEKSVYEPVVYDSQIERTFAEDLEHNHAVKVYAKLPGWFTVPTPLGRYNPDWAVLIDTDEGERLYLVVETKGSLNVSDLRETERAKIKCGRAHIAALSDVDDPAQFRLARTVTDLDVSVSASPSPA